MPCPLCGDICRCSSDPNSAASPRWLPDAGVTLAVEAPQAELATSEASEAKEQSLPPAQEGPDPSAPEDSPAWRQEVAARLNRYQARRKPRPPRYPSLRLHFENEDSPPAASESPVDPQTFPQRATATHRALALDSFADNATAAGEIPESVPPSHPFELPQEMAAFRHTGELQQTAPAAVPATAKAKIIEFPRSWTPAQPPVDELAEPVLNSDRPRILEAPEFVPPPPALGGITIEPAQQPEMEKRPGIDIPLQSAPLSSRICAAAVDGLIIAAAGALFGFIFWKVTAIRPPRLQMIGLAAGLSGLFWAAYQYLLLVYSGTTPGLRLARLELARFDGSPAGRRLRRWRVLASFLSAASLGMGYAWVFLDEDSLCWHDRITHTYLAPRK
jgi:uncharacterized RDD family membrane protein YckC